VASQLSRFPDGLAEAMPSSTFDPSSEDVERLAGGAAMSPIGRRQPHLRVLLSSRDGFLRYGYAFGHAQAWSRIFLPPGVSLRPWELGPEEPATPAAEAAGRDGGRREPGSAQGALALRRRGPLPEPGMDPDPLTRFALAMQEVDEGELVEVALDFRALRPEQAFRWRQTQERRAEVPIGVGAVHAGLAFLAGMTGARPPKAPPTVRLQEVRPAGRGIVFGFRALARAWSPEPSRARWLAELAGFAPLAALAGGRAEVAWEWMAPAPFERAWAGRFRPSTAVRFEEVAGLLVPPTVRCPAPNVRREVMLPEPPPGLEEWTPERVDLVPVGRVRERDVERAVGVPLTGFLFAAEFGRSRWGKALSLGTPLPTPTGWTTMGDVLVGDLLFDERGEPCRVMGASEVMAGHDCFEVEFSDGQRVVADAGHRWRTWNARARKSESYRRGRGRAHHKQERRGWEYPGPQVVTTAQMRATLRDARGAANHAVEVAGPLELAEADLPVDPYVLGAWLGDGNAYAPRLATTDAAILNEVRLAGYGVGDRYRSPSYEGKCPEYPVGRGPDGMTLRFRLGQLGVLRNKHVPSAYLRAGFKQRLALLQGLMDTDGSIERTSAQAELTLCRERLARDAFELVVSLGIRATMPESAARIEGREVGRRWRISFTTGLPVFRLGRKLERVREGGRFRRFRYVVAVRPVPSVPVRCIAVDSLSHLYLAGRGMVPTHNTDDIQLLFRHLTREDGGLFFDPDQDGLERLQRYFGHEPERLLYVNLAPQTGPATVPGWNLFAVASPAAIPRAVATLKDAFVASAGWDSKRAPRATTLVVMAAQAMCELALLCNPDDAPTMFQILTLLEDGKWRAAVIKHLSPRLHRWWKREFAKMPDDAILPITNLIRKFEESPGTLAFFGSSRTTYDVRKAADEGKVVLVCPAGEGDEETRMLTALLTNDAIRAILSRRDVAAESRRWFSVVVDECQEVPAYMIARAVEHFGKYRGRLVCANQDPKRLPDAMRNALFTNCSLIKSTAVGYAGARVIEAEFGGKVKAEAIGNLDRYHFATIFRPERGQTKGPFGARGLGLEQTLGPGDPDGPAKVRAAAMGHRTVDEVRADLATLDERIFLWLAGKELSERHPIRFGVEGEAWADESDDEDLSEWDGSDLTDEEDEDY
jgi:hypothetical protein